MGGTERQADETGDGGARAHRRTGSGAAATSGRRPRGSAGRPGSAAAAAWSPGAGTCPAAAAGRASCGGRLPPLSWGTDVGREVVPRAGGVPLPSARPDALPDARPPLAGVAFTVLVLLPEEAFAVEAGHLVARLDVPQHLHAGRVPVCGHKLGAGPLSALVPGVLPWHRRWPGAPGGRPPCPGPALFTPSLTPCPLWLPPLPWAVHSALALPHTRPGF